MLPINKTQGLDSPSAIRYPNGTESAAFIETFGEDAVLSLHATPEQDAECVLVTYGKVSAEALAARDMLRDEGIALRVVLLEQLMPYSDVASALEPMLRGARRIIYLEEAVRAASVGMMLTDLYHRDYKHSVGAIPAEVLSIRDGFVSGERGRTYYESAGISRYDVIRMVKGE